MWSIGTDELKSFHLSRNAILVKNILLYFLLLSTYHLLNLSLPSRDIIADSIEAVSPSLDYKQILFNIN